MTSSERLDGLNAQMRAQWPVNTGVALMEVARSITALAQSQREASVMQTMAAQERSKAVLAQSLAILAKDLTPLKREPKDASNLIAAIEVYGQKSFRSARANTHDACTGVSMAHARVLRLVKELAA